MISVLYVDADAGLRREVAAFLHSDPDIRVVSLASAYEALDLLREKRFDVIVSESSLAVTTGVTFLDVLRRVRRDSTPFIFFARKSTHADVIEALNIGATFYLLKGNDPQQRFSILRHYIRQACEQHRIKEALVQSEKRYRSVVGDQSEFIIRFKSDGTLVFANDAYCRYFSLAEETLPTGRVTLSRHSGKTTPSSPPFAPLPRTSRRIPASTSWNFPTGGRPGSSGTPALFSMTKPGRSSTSRWAGTSPARRWQSRRSAERSKISGS